MRKMAAAVLAVALAAALAAPAAHAGQREWATAGKILTGVIGLTILGNALANSYPAPVYAAPPRVYYYEPPPREQVWVPGHYETRLERRWVPGHWEIRHHDRYDGDDDDYYEEARRETRRVWIPGRYETVEVRVWIPGHWEDRG